MNFRLIAIQFGDLLKYDTSINEINRIAGAIFSFSCEEFPNESITSVRARQIYNWIMTLGKQPMEQEARSIQLIKFCTKITSDDKKDRVIKILLENNLPYNLVYKDELDSFLSRNFHPQVHQHSKQLFLQGNFFHSVFESAKAYNVAVKEKSNSEKDGQSLMLDVWGWANGVLKITACQTDTDKNVQDGIKFLAAGLMQAIRNPTAHEPALNWPINKQDCLDILSFISFLFRQLDKAICVNG